MSSLKSLVLFAIEIIKKPGEVGAIAPSSKYLGEVIARNVRTNHSSKEQGVNVIEVGPGTGSFTKIIADKLNPNDRLDVIEYNPEFVKVLKDKFKSYPNVNVQCVSITDWKPEYKYDYMVSSLPFNVFDKDFVKQILSHYEDIMKPEGMISYFEYMLFPKIKKQLLPPEKKDNFIKLHEVLSDFRGKYQINKKRVFRNFPPANVYNLKIKAN
ncbi:MAG: methyltransferase domain-containing protein [Candidatus Sericytochromatia bacterium]